MPLFKIVDRQGNPVAPGAIESAQRPLVGDSIGLFNYPSVLTYRVEQYRVRPEWAEYDHFESLALILVESKKNLLAEEGTTNAIAQRIDAKLASATAKFAEIKDLWLSTADMSRLLEGTGFTREALAACNAVAYRDIPVIDAGNESGRSWFDAIDEEGELVPVPISRKNGEAFEIDPDISEVLEDFSAGIMSIDQAEVALTDLFRSRSAPHQAERNIHIILEAVASEVLEVELAAQDLTERLGC